MIRMKRMAMLLAPVAMAMSVGLAGCAAGGYYDDGPEWGGGVGYYGEGGWGRDHAFRHDGGYREGERGRASLGGRMGGGGGHGGGGHAGGGGGGGGGHR